MVHACPTTTTITISATTTTSITKLWRKLPKVEKQNVMERQRGLPKGLAAGGTWGGGRCWQWALGNNVGNYGGNAAAPPSPTYPVSAFTRSSLLLSAVIFSMLLCVCASVCGVCVCVCEFQSLIQITKTHTHANENSAAVCVRVRVCVKSLKFVRWQTNWRTPCENKGLKSFPCMLPSSVSLAPTLSLSHSLFFSMYCGLLLTCSLNLQKLHKNKRISN